MNRTSAKTHTTRQRGIIMPTFSTTWKASNKPGKQRKYRFTAPLHVRGTFLHAHLSKELSKKYGIRSIRIRKGDRVKVMRGSLRKQEGKVEDVNTRKGSILIDKAERTKRDGSVIKIPIQASNVLIIDLNVDDKLRLPQKSQKAQAAQKQESA
jgi:large subunit ribosomal protein L24